MSINSIILAGLLIAVTSESKEGDFGLRSAPVEVTAGAADLQHELRQLEESLGRKVGDPRKPGENCGICGCASLVSSTGICEGLGEALPSSMQCPAGTALQACTSSGVGAGIEVTEKGCVAYSSDKVTPMEVKALCLDAGEHPTSVVESGDGWQEGQEVAASCECGSPIACTCLSPWNKCASTWWYPEEGSGACSQFIPESNGESNGAKVFAICRACRGSVVLP